MDRLNWYCTGQQDAENTCNGVDEIDFDNLLEEGRDIALRRVDDCELDSVDVDLYAYQWARGYNSVYERYRARYLAEIAREIALGNL